jgi:GGDEF domain-containing protein
LAIAKPTTFKGHVFEIDAGIGVSVYPDDGVEIDELISKSDNAMFEDKSKTKSSNKPV